MLETVEYNICYVPQGQHEWIIVDVVFKADGSVGAEPAISARTLESALAWCEAQDPNKAVIIFGAMWIT